MPTQLAWNGVVVVVIVVVQLTPTSQESMSSSSFVVMVVLYSYQRRTTQDLNFISSTSKSYRSSFNLLRSKSIIYTKWDF